MLSDKAQREGRWWKGAGGAHARQKAAKAGNDGNIELDMSWKHKEQENIDKIKLGVFWKQKTQESIERIEFAVFWKQKRRKVLQY